MRHCFLLATVWFAYGLAFPMSLPSSSSLSSPSSSSLHLALHNAPVLECDGCKWLVGKVQTYLKTNEPRLDNVTIGAVEQNICAHLPDNATAFCDHLVEQYVPFAVDSLVEKLLDPTFICTEVVPLCSETAVFQNVTNRVKNPSTMEACVRAINVLHRSQQSVLSTQIFTECKRAHPKRVLECEIVSMHVSTAVGLIGHVEGVCESHVF